MAAAAMPLDERLRFEMLVSRLSARMIALPAGAVDAAVREGLKQIGEFFQADRAVIARRHARIEGWQATHVWQSERLDPARDVYADGRILPGAFPELTAHLDRTGSFVFGSAGELPADWDYERAFVASCGIKAGATVRLSVAGDFLWVIKIDALEAERAWPDDIAARLQFAGEILANGLVRKETQEALDERMRFETLVTTITGELMNLPAAKVDQIIEDGLRMIGEFFGADRAAVSQYLEEEGRFWPSHVWLSKGFDRRRDLAARGGPVPLPRITEHILNEGAVVLDGKDSVPPEWKEELAYLTDAGLKAGVAVALRVHGRFLGIVTVAALRRERAWPPDIVQRLKFVGEIFARALLCKGREETLREAYAEVERLRSQMESDAVLAREEIALAHDHQDMVGSSPALMKVLGLIDQVAGTDSTVLIIGETGTGKELLARAVHAASLRRAHAMVTINCAAMPSTLIESELFGRERGAYTGALTRQVGRFEAAHRGTIFMDEVGELSAEAQAKLLRVLQEGRFERLGSPDPIDVDIRVIAATNRDLARAVREGKFREDLFYRLNVFPIAVPPLRERREDIPRLVWHFVQEFGEKMGKRIESIPRKTMETLQGYAWPGNIRELRNVIERGMILARGPVLYAEVPRAPVSLRFKETDLAEVERRHILEVLEFASWRVRGEGGAAEMLGLKPTTLEARMRKLGINRQGASRREES